MHSPYLFTAPARSGLLTLFLLLGACGQTDQPSLTSGNEDPAVDGADDADDDDDDDRACSEDGQTETCTCTSGNRGMRTCSRGRYGSCKCTGTGDTEQDDVRPTFQPKCKAGYYTGNFSGKYRPGAFGFGIFASGFEVDIAGGESFFDNSLPPLAFTLSEEYEGVGEFQTVTIGGGCLQGLATAVVITQSPFVAALTGDLNCATGEFVGRLDGYYTLIGIPGADFSFSGPVSGQFDFEQASLEDGEWSVEEPPAVDGSPAGGGEGVWDARWTADKAPMLGIDPCADIGPGGTHAPITDDAGQALPQDEAAAP